MEKHFCDRCEREIKEDGDFVFGKELCKDCCEKIEYFINNPDTIISNPKFEKELEYERLLVSGDKRAIAHFKMKHGYTLSKEDIDILKEDKVEKKDPCAGLTCYEEKEDGLYYRCVECTHTHNAQEGFHYFDCANKGTGVAIPEKDFGEGLVIEPYEFDEEE